MQEDLSAYSLLAGLLLGIGLELLYELLRPVRYRAGRASALVDVLFALFAGFAVFLLGMSAENGRLGLWELAAALAGFLCCLYFLSSFKRGITGILSHIRTKKVK